MNEIVLFCAFRYALGRMTYVVNEVAEEIIKNAPSLSPKMRRKIIQEIDDAPGLGMNIDKADWMRVKEVLSKI